jgi:hypothetical protein
MSRPAMSRDQTPPGVSLENYRIYFRLLHEYIRQQPALTETIK